MKKYPIGIQTFKDIIEENYYYVDKTQHIMNLFSGGKYYFLSRPRRFGKSLLVSTMESAFVGKKELFKGLSLENTWDWSVKHPVINMSFGSGVHRSVEELQDSFAYILKNCCSDYGVSLTEISLKNQFAELIKSLHNKLGKVVILIDEYDKPILDNINNIDLARDIREELKNYYSVIKDSDKYLHFVFITGVSKFSKVSLFSGLNNLEDITLTSSFADICGYNQQELEFTFKDSLIGLDLNEIKKWYNGYNFNNPNKKVYNPFDVLLYLKNREFKNYWFETATPTFLINLLEDNHYFIPQLDCLNLGESLVGQFDIESINLETLLFQCGYLTIIKKYTRGPRTYYLCSFPNLEVKMSLTDHILGWLTQKQSQRFDELGTLFDTLVNCDIDQLRDIFSSFFASIPNDWYRKNSIARYEGYYSSIFYTYFTALGVHTIPEDVTSKGRIDLTVMMDHAIFIFEFKVTELDKGSKEPLHQIKNKNYHEKYHSSKLPIYIIGIEFSGEERNIIFYQWEVVS